MATSVSSIGDILGSMKTPTISNVETNNDNPSPKCFACNDSGYIFKRDQNGHNICEPCRVCNIAHKRCVQRLLEKAELPYHTMDVRPHNQTFEYIRSFDPNKPLWAVFSGKAGSGKTTEAAWLAYQLICKRHSRTLFRSFDETIRRLQSIRNRQQEYDALLDSFVDADLVVLDDFLKGIPSPNSYRYAEYMEACYSLIWARYDARKPLVLTTQIPAQSLVKVDTALAGRILEMSKGYVVQYGEDAKSWRAR